MSKAKQPAKSTAKSVNAALTRLVKRRLEAIVNAEPYHDLAAELIGYGLSEQGLADLLRGNDRQRDSFRYIPSPATITLENAFRDLSLDRTPLRA